MKLNQLLAVAIIGIACIGCNQEQKTTPTIQPINQIPQQTETVTDQKAATSGQTTNNYAYVFNGPTVPVQNPSEQSFSLDPNGMLTVAMADTTDGGAFAAAPSGHSMGNVSISYTVTGGDTQPSLAGTSSPAVSADTSQDSTQTSNPTATQEPRSDISASVPITVAQAAEVASNAANKGDLTADQAQDLKSALLENADPSDRETLSKILDGILGTGSTADPNAG